jgi:hypothetical protein
MPGEKNSDLGSRLAWALVVAALVLFSFMLSFGVYLAFETAYGGETMHLIGQPADWMLDMSWAPIFHIMTIFLLSRPLWKDHPEEQGRAPLLFALTAVLYILWGFVLMALPGWERPLDQAGYFLLFFIVLYHLTRIINIRLQNAQ